MPNGASQLVIFGNPKVGTPAMVENPLSGLALPLKVLVYEDDGQTLMPWEEPLDRFMDLVGGLNPETLTPMNDALNNLTGAAAK